MLVVTLIGWQVAGLAGALVATLAMCLPMSVVVHLLFGHWDRFRGARWQRAAARRGAAGGGTDLLGGRRWSDSRPGWAGGWGFVLAVAVFSTRTKFHPLWCIAAGAYWGWQASSRVALDLRRGVGAAEFTEPGNHTFAIAFRLVLTGLPFAFERFDRDFNADDGGEHLLDVIGRCIALTAHGSAKALSCRCVSASTCRRSQPASWMTVRAAGMDDGMVPGRYGLAVLPLGRVPAGVI